MELQPARLKQEGNINYRILYVFLWFYKFVKSADEYERNQALTLGNKEAKLQLELKTEQLDESNEWYSIKRWAKENGVNWKKISRMKMKAISCKLGYEIKKIFDDNHCQVNTYNVNVFKEYFNKCE